MLNAKPQDLPKADSLRPKLEEGTYPALLNLLVDLGIQKDEDFTTKKEKQEHQLWIGFQFPTEVYELEQEDGTIVERAQTLGKRYKVSNHEKSNLQKLFDTLCDPSESYADMLAAPCTVSVGMTSGGNARVDSVTKPMKGSKVSPHDSALPFMITDQDYDNPKLMDQLPEFLVTLIQTQVK